MKLGGRHRRIPDIKLEQYLLGELSEKELAETSRLLDKNEESRARLAAMEQSNREILDRYPPDLMSREIQARMDSRIQQTSIKRFLRPGPLTAFMGAAAVMFCLFLVLPGQFNTPEIREIASEVRLKGQGPQLKIYRKTPDGSESLEDGARTFPGDVIRIGYQAAGRPYGTIVSVDGWGKATLHLPNEGSLSVRLKSDGRILLDFALELDDAPGWERFYFVTSDAPFDVSPVLEAARQIDLARPVDLPENLDLPRVLDQFVFSLEKGAH
jgi:hypothetical protein